MEMTIANGITAGIAFLSMIATIASAVAARALHEMAKEERFLKERQSKRDTIKKFLRSRYGVHCRHRLAEILSEIPIAFSDAPAVLNIRAIIRDRSSSDHPTRPDPGAGAFDGSIDLLLGDLLAAMCKDAGLEYKCSNELEPFADTELSGVAYRAGASTKIDFTEWSL